MHQADRAGEIERAYGGGDPRFDIEHHGCVLSAVIDSAAFLEAMANELYQDAADGHGFTGDGYLAPLGDDTRRRMAQLWRETAGGQRLRVMANYRMLLARAGQEPLDPGAQPYQDGREVIRLRNTLVHFVPESMASDEAHAMEKHLRGRFPDNAFMAGTGNAWWPDFCLGHGCSTWAHMSAVALADQAAQALGIRPNYQRVRVDNWKGYERAPGESASR